jgi:hypothetical protein
MLRQLFFLLLATLCLAPAPNLVAHTHKGPEGPVSWYPNECCNHGDCRPVTRVQKAPHGLWLITDDGVTVLIGPKDQRRPSKDGRWHHCVTPDIELQTDGIVCIFEPANS